MHGVSVTVYDDTRALKSTATGVYQSKKLSEIFADICSKFSIKSNICDTGFVIPYLFYENKSYFEILDDAIEQTRLMTGKTYVFLFETTGATLSLLESNSTIYEVTNQQIVAHESSMSIDNAINYVEIYQLSANLLYSKYIVKNDAHIKKYGILAKSVKVNKSYSASECRNIGLNYLDPTDALYDTIKLKITADKIINICDALKLNSQIYIVTQAVLDISSSSHTYTVYLKFWGGI